MHVVWWKNECNIARQYFGSAGRFQVPVTETDLEVKGNASVESKSLKVKVLKVRCSGCACGGRYVMPRKRSWAVHYRRRHAEQVNCKKFRVAKDATLSNARTKGSIPKYALSGKTEGGSWCNDCRGVAAQ